MVAAFDVGTVVGQDRQYFAPRGVGGGMQRCPARNVLALMNRCSLQRPVESARKRRLRQTARDTECQQATCCSSSLTTSSCPFSAARCKAVKPLQST